MAEVNTSLRISFEVCESPNCKFLTIRDTTGVYNSISNPGGWDNAELANPSAAEVTEVTITITTPSGTVHTFTSSNTISTTDYLPDINKLKEYPILYSSLGTTGSIVDGIYEIKVEYTGDWDSNSYTASSTCEVLLSCQVSCCLDKLAKEIAKSQCIDCKKEAIEKISNAKMYLDAAKDAVACGMSNLGKINLAAAQWYCNEHNCKNCYK